MLDQFSMTRRRFVKTACVASGAVLAGPSAMAAQGQSISVALLGVAHMHTPMYLQILRMREDVKVKYVWDHDPARATKVAEACGARVARSAAEAVADAEVVGVVILSETSLHAELASLAAKARKHVFIEKPIGVGAKDASEIADVVEKAGILFTTGYHLRTIPKYIFVKQFIGKGAFGKIVRLECSFSNDCLLQGVFDKEFKWTVDPKWGALGGFADTGTHALDMLMWLMGDVEAVSADIRTVTNRYAGCDETGQALIRFRNGVTASLSAGWIEPENPVALAGLGNRRPRRGIQRAAVPADQESRGCRRGSSLGKAPSRAGPSRASVRQRDRREQGHAFGDGSGGGGPSESHGGPLPGVAAASVGDDRFRYFLNASVSSP